MKETGEEEFNVCLLFGDQHERGQFDSIGRGVPTPEGLWIHISIDAFTTADKSNMLCTFNCQSSRANRGAASSGALCLGT